MADYDEHAERCGPTRIKGDALLLTIDGRSYWADCSSAIFTREDEQDTRTADGTPQGVNVQWALDVQAVQSMQAGSLYRLMWEHGGKRGASWLPFRYSPFGSGEPTDERPHFVGTLWLPDVDALGGEAGRKSEYVFSAHMPLRCKPRMVTQSDPDPDEALEPDETPSTPTPTPIP